MGEITVMAKNNFKPFATAANANVTAQADWETLPALLSGFTAGKASSAQVNKAIRQASFIAAALAQYTANKSGLDVLDDGDLNGFISKMGTAFGKDFQALDATLSALAGLATGANKLPYFTGNDTAAQTDLTQVGRDIIGKSSVSDVLKYLGLGDGTGRLINVQTFTSSGTYTPTAGTKFVIAEVLGGGGGGGSNSTTVSAGYASGGQGGGAGSMVVAKFLISAPLSVVVGAGGNGGSPNPSSGNPGGNGGQSSIGGLIATGGRGGAAGAAFNVLPTGANTTSQNAANTIPGGVTLIAQHRGKGALSAALYSPNNASSGKGADSDYGFGGPSIAISSGTNNAAGVNATGNAAGGSGAVSITGTGNTGVSVAGGNGSAGIVIVWEYA